MAFKKILVPLDGSILAEHAIGPAAELAAGGADRDARPSCRGPWPPRASIATDMQVDVVREAEEYLARVAARLERDGTKNVQTSVWYGPPVSAIVEAGAAARRRPHRHEHPWPERARPPHPGERGRGGAAQHDDADPARARVRGAAWRRSAVRPRRRSTPVYKRAIVPLDGSPFAEAILPFLRQIAGPLDMEVILLRVVAPQPMAPIEAPPHVLIRELETRRVDAEEYLARLAADLREPRRAGRRAREPGEAAHEILAVARETAADLIAMCTHDRSGFGRFVFGSVAEAVVRRAGIPVLLLKPGETEPRQVGNDNGA